MPGGDGTGPGGMGPMTGRAAGYCAGYSVPGYMNPVGGRGGFGRGWGRGFGRGGGRGWGRGFGRGWGGGFSYGAGAPYGAPPAPYGAPYAPGAYGDPYAPQMDAQQEAALLKDQAKAIEEELKAVNKRLGELEAEAKKAK